MRSRARHEGLLDFSQLTAQVEDWLASGVYPGAALFIGKGDEILLERYFGAYNPDTSVHVASAGKWLAVATIASVVDRGQLRWDDPVSKWLPEMQGPKGRATLRQLLSHTAGYPDYLASLSVPASAAPGVSTARISASTAQMRKKERRVVPASIKTYTESAPRSAGRCANCRWEGSNGQNDTPGL